MSHAVKGGHGHKPVKTQVSKITVAGPLKEASRALSALASAGIFHPEEGKVTDRGLELEGMEDLADRIVKLKSLVDLIGPFFKGRRVPKHQTLPLKDLKQKADQLLIKADEHVISLLEKEKQLNRDLEALKEDLQVMTNLNQDIDLGVLKSRNVFMAAGKMPTDAVKKLKEDLVAHLPEHVMISGFWDEGWSYAFIGVILGNSDKLKQMLDEHKWLGIHIPKASGKISEIADILKAQIRATEKVIHQARSQLVDAVASLYPNLVAVLEMLENYYRVVELAKYARQTKYAFFLEGWVPKSQKVALLKLMQKTDGVVVKEPEFDPEDAPVFIQHNKVSKPFYSVLSLVGPPKEGKFDPTPTLALTFPLFFGMMVGDVGYGVLITLMALLLKDQMNALFKSLLGKEFGDFSKVLLISGITSIIFGFLFGEVFGNLAHGLLRPILFDRLEGIVPLMVSSAVIGVVHLNFGLLIKFFQELAHSATHAILGVGSWFLLQGVVVLLALGQTTPGLVLLTISVIFMGKFEGIQGVLEIPGFVSNVFSYMRLAAIGLASAGIALAMNVLASMAGAVAGILVLILGHSLNLVLAILDPFIQSTRLHLVEFGGKFYTPARRHYTPFSISNKFTGGEMIWMD